MRKQRKFQSTHPMRGATGSNSAGKSYYNISIHAPHARCDFQRFRAELKKDISIHAPHARCDNDNIFN